MRICGTLSAEGDVFNIDIDVLVIYGAAKALHQSCAAVARVGVGEVRRWWHPDGMR